MRVVGWRGPRKLHEDLPDRRQPAWHGCLDELIRRSVAATRGPWDSACIGEARRLLCLVQMPSLRRSSCLLVLIAACGSIEPVFVDGGADDVEATDANPFDPTVPQTTLTVTPAALSNQATARFEFTADRPSTFACRVDGGAAAPCTSPHTIPVADGPHVFEVTATTSSGVTDPSPAMHAWRVDTVAPDSSFQQVPAALDNSTTVRFEFRSTELSTFVCTLDSGATLPCEPPHSVSGLTDGAHAFRVLATDLAGNVELAPAVHGWAIDTSTPDTQIELAPSGAVSSAVARITFASPDAGAGATFECALDAAVFAPCSSPRDLAGLAEGERTFRVRVRDATGNYDPTPAERRWTVDTIAPTATVTSISVPTSDTTPTFGFTTAGNPATTECRMGTAAFGPCTTATSHTSAALADGVHTLEVRVRDDAGNIGAATGTVTVDTVAPTVTIAPRQTPTSDTTPAFTFTTAGNPTTIQCRMNTMPFGACSSSTSYVPPALADGDHTLEVRVTDDAGNIGAATAMVTVDTMGPTVTIAAVTVPTSDPTPTLTFVTTGTPTSIQCRMGAAAHGPCTTATSHTPAALADGTHTLEVLVMDGAGNTAVDTEAVTVDTVAPTVTITPFALPTSDSTPTFTFATAGSPISVQCRMGAAAFGACTTATSHTPAALGDATHTLEVRVTDGAGNTGAATANVTVDTVAPTVTITAFALPTNDPTPTFTFATAGNPTTVQCRMGAAAFGACTTATSHTPAVLGDATHTLEVRVADGAGNAGTATANVTVDTVAPAVSIGAYTTPTRNPTPTFPFTAGADAVSVTCRMDAAGPGACTTATSHIAAALSPDGNHTFEVQVTDLAGNLRSATAVVVLDTTGPDGVILSGGGTNGLTNDRTPSFTFAADPSAVAIECRMNTGLYTACPTSTTYTATSLGDGVHTFSLRLRDAVGNNAVYTRVFTVDGTPPSMTFTTVPAQSNSSDPVRYVWTTSGGVADTDCRLYQSNTVPPAYAPCSTPHNADVFTHTGTILFIFQVRVTDAAGNPAVGQDDFSHFIVN